MLCKARTHEEAVDFAEPAEGAEMSDDYGAMGLSLRRHPLALIRSQLAEWGIRSHRRRSG